MKQRQNGFTMVELVIVILIGSILTSVALSSFQGAQAALAVRSAKAMYATMHQRARSKAVESGVTVILVVDMAGDSTFTWSPGGITDVVRFRSELNVDLRASTSYFMCYTPRGYADYNCGAYAGLINATVSTPHRVEFWQNADSTSVIVLPMGQLVGL